MNWPAHLLAVFSAFMHVAMGLFGPLGIGPPFLPPSWRAIYMLVPGGEWLYPASYVLTGLVALVGVVKPRALQVSYVMSAVVFLAWGAAGLWLTREGMPGGNLQGSFANLYVFGLCLGLTYYVSVGLRGDQINVQVERLAEQVHQGNGHGPATK